MVLHNVRVHVQLKVNMQRIWSQILVGKSMVDSSAFTYVCYYLLALNMHLAAFQPLSCGLTANTEWCEYV